MPTVSRLRAIAALLLLGVAVFELAAVVVNAVQLDMVASRAASVAAGSFGTTSSLVAAQAAVAESVLSDGSAVTDVAITEHHAVVALSRPAAVLLIDRFAVFHGAVVPTARASTARPASAQAARRAVAHLPALKQPEGR